jgi:hypothetical protein
MQPSHGYGVLSIFVIIGVLQKRMLHFRSESGSPSLVRLKSALIWCHGNDYWFLKYSTFFDNPHTWNYRTLSTVRQTPVLLLRARRSAEGIAVIDRAVDRSVGYCCSIGFQFDFKFTRGQRFYYAIYYAITCCRCYM